ncbi:hypothetical protein ASE37_20600 [Rhizobium sp. Root268]|nr:hypothetical protein ASC86_21310 [Rhizobium sp. Root1212]KRD36111.1 hypothetical protein ASE37_20600 [Rhizobium sp. Root268]
MEKSEHNARFIFATNSDLAKRVEAGTFRADLYFRINVIQIHLPPLVEIVLDYAGRDWLAEKGWDPALWCAPFETADPALCTNPLAEMILAGEVRDGTSVRISAIDGDITFNGKKPEFVHEGEFDMI